MCPGESVTRPIQAQKKLPISVAASGSVASQEKNLFSDVIARSDELGARP